MFTPSPWIVPQHPMNVRYLIHRLPGARQLKLFKLRKALSAPAMALAVTPLLAVGALAVY